MKKIKLFLAAVAAMVSLSVNAQTWTASEVGEGDFYLYNVGADGFLIGSNNWGCRASLTKTGGINVTLTNISEDVYSISTNPTFKNCYLGKDGYVDKASNNAQYTTWKFAAVEGKENTYTLQAEAGNGQYIQWDGSTSTTTSMVDAAPSTDAGYWKLVTKTNLLAYLQENAKSTNGLDATFLIQNPNFDRASNTALWTMVASNQNLAGGVNENFCAESYHAEFTLSQVLTEVPNGEYELKAQGFYRQDGSDNEHLPVFYINDKTATFHAMTGSENSMSDASNSFTAGNYTIDPIRVTVGNGKIALGAKLEGNTNLWCIFDNFTLTYYGIDLTAYESQITTLRTTLTALVDQPMNATVLETANTALSETASVAHDQSAMEAAIAQLNTAVEAANASIANYAEAKTYLDKSSTLDAAGQASYAANETVAAIQSAYTAATLEVLTNEQKTAMDAAIITAAKAQTTAGSDWTLALVNPSFENGFTGWINSNMQTQDNKQFGGVVGNIYCEAWQPNGTKSVKQAVTLPAGVYTISANVMGRGVTNSKIFANGFDTTIPVSGDWSSKSVQFVSDGNAELELGFEGTGTGAGTSWLCVDNFQMTLVSAGMPDVVAATGKMNADVATAQTTAINTYNGEKTVANYNAALAAIAAAQASVDAYAKTAQFITDAKALKASHNFVTADAVTAFENAITTTETAYDEGSLTDDQANNGNNLGFIQVDWHAQREEANRTAAEAYMKSVDFGMNYNDWSWEGASDGSNFVIPFFEYWVSDDNSLAAATKTATLTDLPNGLYTVQAWVRVRAKNETAATDATGITMDVNGGGKGDYAAVDVTEGTQVGETQFTIGTFTAQGLVKQGTLTLNFNVADGTNISWLSFKNIKYTKVRDLTPEEAFVAATPEDYAALNAAIAAYTLGFEAGEYAPYNNVEAAKALAAAQAIDQTAQNSQEDVQTATTAITDATWTANETEVNAIWDGSFEHEYSTSGNVQPIGWHGVGDKDNATNVRWMWNVSSNAGLNATTSKKALFAKYTALYGTETGYTLPLKEGYYKLTFKYGGWNEVGERIIKLYAGDTNAEVAVNKVKAKDNKGHTTASSWAEYSSVIKVPSAGNYVLSLYRENTTSQNQIVLGDIVLIKATAADFKPALLAEITTANDVDVTTNVGDGVFQIPTRAATALTTAISDAQAVYDNADATIDDVIAATESVPTAVETYNNVELNAPDAAKRYAVTMHDAGKAWDGNAITFIAGGRDGDGNYNVKYEAPANVNLAQALKFTAVEGKSNTFYISVVNANGTEQYLTSKTLAYGNGTVNDQIRTTDDATKAVEITVKVANDVEGFKLFNQTGTEIARNSSSPDNGLYPNGNVGSYFTIAETSKPSIAINTTDAGWGTVILPFAVASLPEGVKAYSVSELKADQKELNLEDVDVLEANKPYIIEGAWEANLTGDAQGTALTYTDGLLTGVYAEQFAPAGKYVLQKINEVVAFYRVAEGEDQQPKVKANRAYLTDPNADGSVKAFYFPGTTTAIQGVFSEMANGNIYDLQGRKVQKMQKGGIYVINGHKVTVK